MVVNQEAVKLIIDKLLSDGELEAQINDMRTSISLTSLSKEYIEAALKLLIKDRGNVTEFDVENFEMGIYGGVIYRRMVMKYAGDIVASHKHTYDHFTYVENGTVDINGVIYHSGQWARVPKEVEHTIKALEQNSITYCINSEHEVMESN